MNTNINNAMKRFFDELDIDPIEFDYYESKKKFISREAFTYNDDPQAYYIVVKITNNTVGTVLLGTSDGIKFTEVNMLGQILFNGTEWE